MLFLLVSSGLRESPTYDEITYVEDGYQFLVNQDFRFDPFSPPLAKEIIALPALINKVVLRDLVIFWPRMMVILFTIALGIIVYLFSKRMFGNLAGKLALAFYIFEPNILANGHYATADLIFTFFLVLSLFIFWSWKNKFTNRRIVIFSVILGMLMSTKITSIPFLILPIIILYIMDKNNNRSLSKILTNKKKIINFFLIIIITSFTLWATYFFKSEPLLGYRFDKNRPAIGLAKANSFINFALTQPVPLGSYISTIKQTALFNYSNLYIKRSFFSGKLYDYGSPGYYYPFLFLIKTPLPLLILLFSSLILFMKKTGSGKYVLVPIFVIFLTVLFSKVTLVSRYILPVYPLSIIYLSQIINLKTSRKKIIYFSIGLLLIWHVSGSISLFPNFISYVNELFGGSKNAYKYLVDSNSDWGQGLTALKNYQDANKINNLQLAYFGSVDPGKYGIKYERIKNLAIGDNHKEVNLKFDSTHTIAISATCWYFCGYYKNPEFSNSNPIDVVGGSILIFRKK
ncbi:MAG: glycosyltransferase family 39 protein [bacterium]|nr:glycosyltransferase family 39 protein [bacterium]